MHLRYQKDQYTFQRFLSKYGLNAADFLNQFTLKWHQRSVDTFLGLPFNIASYALLAHIIGKLTNMVPKGIIGDLSNVHIYEPHLDAVKEQLSREPKKLPTLNIPELKTFSPEDWTIDMFNLENYESHPAISAEMIAP